MGFYQEYLSNVVMKNNFTFRHYRTIEDCINAVLKGETQFVLLNTYQLEYYYTGPHKGDQSLRREEWEAVE